MQQTSLDTYFALREEGKLGTMQQMVYDAFTRFGDHTDLELTHLLGWQDPNWVRPRRNELVKLGLIKEKERRTCMISGRKAIVWGKRRAGLLLAL